MSIVLTVLRILAHRVQLTCIAYKVQLVNRSGIVIGIVISEAKIEPDFDLDTDFDLDFDFALRTSKIT